MNGRVFAFKILLLVFLNSTFFNLKAVNKYWIATSSGNWNNSANWSTTSGGTVTTTVPGASDIANFDGNGFGNCVIDATINIAGINVASVYNGSILQNAFVITIGTSNAMFSGGVFSGGSAAINCNGTLTLSGTLFTSTTSTCTIKGATTFSSGSFLHNNGTVAFSTNTFTVTGNFTFYNLIALGNYNALTFSNSNIVQNNLTLTATSGDIGINLSSLIVNSTTLMQGVNSVRLLSGTLNAMGDITTSFSGDPYGSGTGIINISGTGNQLINTTSAAGQGILSNITINKTAGTLILKGNIALYGTWNYIQGTVDAGTNLSTVIFPEGNSCVLDGQGISSTMSFYNVSIGITSGVQVVLAGDLIVKNNLAINNPSTSSNAILDATSSGYNIYIGGNLTGESDSQFFQGNSTVIFNGISNQTILLGSSTDNQTQNVFYNLTINKISGSVQMFSNNFWVTNNLVLTGGNINLNSLTLTLGKGVGTGNLTRTEGWLYGGTFTRWFSTASIIIPSNTGLFPIGWASDYCPFWLGYSSGLITGGTVSVNFNYIVDNINPFVTFNDPSWSSGTTVVDASNSSWVISTANNFTASGNNIQIRYGGGLTSFGTNILADINSCLSNTVVGTFSSATNNIVATEANRIGLNNAQLTNVFLLGTSDNGLNQATLPIELINFSATTNENKVDLKWETATETNNAFFTIEKSNDGMNFIKLMDISGAGNSLSYRTYFETDYQPYADVSYYRLKQTDFNGVYKYFNIVSVKNTGDKNIFFYPNPLDNTSNLNFKITGYKNQEITVVLRDVNGTEFLSKVLLSEEDYQLFIIDERKNLASGTYIVIATTNDKIYNYKLIIK